MQKIKDRKIVSADRKTKEMEYKGYGGEENNNDKRLKEQRREAMRRGGERKIEKKGTIIKVTTVIVPEAPYSCVWQRGCPRC